MTAPDPTVRPHAGRARGDRRRAQLVDAGVQVLAENGWSGTTARAVADRAGAQLGLIHYHFGGFPQLKRAITAAVLDGAFQPVLSTIADAERWQDGLAQVVAAGREGADGAAGRLGAELIVASLQDEEVRRQLQEALAAARSRLVRVLQDGGVPVEDAEGTAALVVALLDGLLLHRLVDPGLPLDAVARVVARSRHAGPLDVGTPEP